MESHVVFTKFLFIILIFLFVGCDDMSVSTGDGSNKVKGNGKVTTEVREIGSFDEIILEGVFNVYLLQKEKESVRVETDENLLPFIVTEVENNVLTIKMKDNSEIEKMKKINIYITLVDINNLETKGVGLINCMGQLKLKNIDLSLNGVGATHLNLICDTLNVKSELVGSLHLIGEGESLKIKHSGIGSFEAFEFKAEGVNIESDGIGKVEVNASKELVVDAKGLGGVKYKGNPALKDIKNEGVGVVVSAE